MIDSNANNIAVAGLSDTTRRREPDDVGYLEILVQIRKQEEAEQLRNVEEMLRGGVGHPHPHD